MSRRTKPVLVILNFCLAVSTASAQIQKMGTTPTPKPPQSQSKMSPAFQKQGQRASDAIMRVQVPSAGRYQAGFEQRQLDAEKAIDEAKYKARTIKDKHVLRMLRAAGFLIEFAKARNADDPDWRLIGVAFITCQIEIAVEFDPNFLTAAGRKQEKTCLKQHDALLKMWEERRDP